MPSLAQVTAMWDYLIKRVARRRRILETILAAARPLRITDQTLVLGFPAQHRFQQELVESEEYRSLLEDELQKAFGVHFEITTEVYPA
jgi:DNA polymerase III subunit tau-like protein